jgi:transposase-like protein
MNELPQTLQQAILYFSDPDNALNFAVNMRWPNGQIVCPRCECDQTSFIATRRVWECKGCRKQFSVKVGTIFEDSPIGLDKWLCAMWMIANDKNGVSSYEIARGLAVTQKSAWFMLHRIRFAMQQQSLEKKLSGHVEADETFIGGKARNMHLDVYTRRLMEGRIAKGGPGGKAIVMGLLERKGQARVKVINARRKKQIQAEVRENVEPGSNLYTDSLMSYAGLSPDYVHEFVDHAETYVKGIVHTNGMENFWSLFKRTLKGTYVSVEPFHLQAYADEQAFRFNNRHTDDLNRFCIVASSVAGRRLTYKELTGKELDTPLS